MTLLIACLIIGFAIGSAITWAVLFIKARRVLRRAEREQARVAAIMKRYRG